jgi:hypothetical protein
MDPEDIGVKRTLPIDGALLSDVLLRLRRDSAASVLRWTLGHLGAAEVDVCFTSAGTEWTTQARLWNESGLAMTAATLRLVASSPDEVCLTLEPTPSPFAAQGEGPDVGALGRAAVDEFAEELLWHATRAGFTPRG